MPNLAKMLKDEIARLSKKEIKSYSPNLKKEIAGLIRDVKRLKKETAKMKKMIAEQISNSTKRKLVELTTTKEVPEKSRLNSALISKLRAKLKLTRQEFGTLLNVTQNTVYLWEKGRTEPSKETKAAIIEMRSLKRRELKNLLATAMKEQGIVPKKRRLTRKKASKKKAAKK